MKTGTRRTVCVTSQTSPPFPRQWWWWCCDGSGGCWWWCRGVAVTSPSRHPLTSLPWRLEAGAGGVRMFTPGDSTKYGGHTYILEQSADRASIVFCHTGGYFRFRSRQPLSPSLSDHWRLDWEQSGCLQVAIVLSLGTKGRREWRGLWKKNNLFLDRCPWQQCGRVGKARC